MNVERRTRQATWASLDSRLGQMINEQRTHESRFPKNSGDDDHNDKRICPLKRDEVLIDERHAGVAPCTDELEKTIPVKWYISM